VILCGCVRACVYVCVYVCVCVVYECVCMFAARTVDRGREDAVAAGFMKH